MYRILLNRSRGIYWFLLLSAAIIQGGLHLLFADLMWLVFVYFWYHCTAILKHLFNIVFLECSFYILRFQIIFSVRPPLMGGFYSRAASIQGRLLFKGGFYSRAASIQGRLLFKDGFYSRELLSKDGFYSRADSIQGRLQFKKLRYVSVCKVFNPTYITDTKAINDQWPHGQLLLCPKRTRQKFAVMSTVPKHLNTS